MFPCQSKDNPKILKISLQNMEQKQIETCRFIYAPHCVSLDESEKGF